MMIPAAKHARNEGRHPSPMAAKLAGLLLLAIEQALALEPRRGAVGAASTSVERGLPSASPASISNPPAPDAAIAPTDIESAGRRIVVSLADRKLVLLDGRQIVKVYRVAVGARSTPSPAGEFAISTRIANPTWYHPGKVIGPGKDNPVGTRWVGLTRKGYGIHGTNVPSSIGRAASHGCIRMRNQDVEELFKLVRVGDAVEITPEPESEALAHILPGPGAPPAVAQSQNPAQPDTSAGEAPAEAAPGQ